YKDFRSPPWESEKYEYTRIYWHVIAAKFIFVLVFESATLLLTTIVAALVPDMPRRVDILMRREALLVNEVILRAELKKEKRARRFGELNRLGSGEDTIDTGLRRRNIMRQQNTFGLSMDDAPIGNEPEPSIGFTSYEHNTGPQVD
ncbi:unnamed protein product, partial [Protopolystoma xenopodis]